MGRPRGRNFQAVRELRMILALERCRLGLTLREMSAMFEVTERTIRRDVAALEEAGVPLIQEDGGRWRVLNWRNLSEVA